MRNLDSLISLLIFIIFIGLPLLNRLSRSRRGSAPPRRPPGPPGQPGRTPPTLGAPDAETRPPAEMDETFARRLEEARRRVQDAMGGPGSGPSAQTPAGTGSQGQATTAPVPVPPPAAAPFIPAATRPETPPERRELETGTGIRRSQPLERTRRGKRSARETRDRLLSVAKRDILSGIIWKQILEEPAHQRRRRQISPPR